METIKEDIQVVAPDITLHWVHDGRIAVFTLRTVARNALALWAEMMFNLMDEWPIERPFLCVQDNDFKESSFTPTIRDYSIQFTKYRPGLTLCAAIVLPRTMVSQFVRLFLRTVQQPKVQAHVFFHVEEAIAWLGTKL
jgi:hypothetical protein